MDVVTPPSIVWFVDIFDNRFRFALIVTGDSGIDASHRIKFVEIFTQGPRRRSEGKPSSREYSGASFF